jgi:CubicO group peptidase (beta-lactamase class C family)
MLNTPDRLVREALNAGVGSAAVLHVRHRGEVLHQVGYGRTQHGPEGRPVTAESLFDLASLTKPLCVGTLAACLVESGHLALDMRLADLLPLWRGQDRESVTLAELLQHRSGLPDWRPFFRRLDPVRPREARLEAACREPLLHPPGETVR